MSQPQRRPRPRLNIKSKEHLALRLSRPVELLETLARYRGAHYRSRAIPKREPARRRRISPPRAILKSVQRRINDALLKDLWLPDVVHGYRPARSIVSAAGPHRGARFLFVLDIRDFFPSITHRRVYKMYTLLGCAPDVAKLLTELTTHGRCLPQGAPTSSSLANLYLRLSGLAKRLSHLAKRHRLRLTIFGDDILISGEASFIGLKSHLVSIIESCGLSINETKSRSTRPGEQQHVLGIITNSGGSSLNVPATYRRRLRALIRLSRRCGLAALQLGEKDPVAYLRGKIAFAVYINSANSHLYDELNFVLTRMPQDRTVDTIV